MRILTLIAGVALVAAGAAFGKQSEAQQAKSRIVDRTLACGISAANPREISVVARSGVREFNDRSRWKWRPSAAFSDPRSGSPTVTSVSASVSAGWPPEGDSTAPFVGGEVLRYSVRCSPSPRRVTLTSRGLVGGLAGQLGDRYDCVAPARILVRVRGVFYAPTSLRRWRPGGSIDELVARGRMKEGTLSIHTASGKPIALATVHESGRARLFVGTSCGPSG